MKTFLVRDLEFLKKEFYLKYDPDYWLHKIFLFKNSHDFYDKLEKDLNFDLEDVNADDFKRMIRTEMHFLYFQMIETLFEIIFALTEHDNRNLWISLTFSNDRRTKFYSNSYKKIKDFSEGKLKNPDFWTNIETIIEKETVKIPLLRWIFYFIYPSKQSEDEWKLTLKHIYSLLKVFSKDFSDRGEYNAYKHSLRFYNSPFQMAIGPDNSTEIIGVGKSEDSIVYLEEKNNGEHISIAKTTKPFDFDRDFRLCLCIYHLINNIINTRKYSLIEDFTGKQFKFVTFADLKLHEFIHKKTGVYRFSYDI